MSSISANRSASPQPSALRRPIPNASGTADSSTASAAILDDPTQTPARATSSDVFTRSALTPPNRPVSPRTRAVAQLVATRPTFEGIDALAKRDLCDNAGRLTKVFSKYPNDPVLRQRGLELALRDKFIGPLSASLDHELRIIRVVSSIDSARDSQRYFQGLIATHEQTIIDMPFMAGMLRSGIDLNKQFIEEQEESIGQNSKYLESLLNRLY